jgi:hypothetical protein
MRDRLSKELSPAPNTEGEQQARRATVLATLFAVLPSDTVTDQQADIRVNFWLQLISDRAAIEIETAAVWWAGAKYVEEGENRSFAPRPAGLLRLADIAREKFMHELANIERVLKAEVWIGNGGYLNAAE